MPNTEEQYVTESTRYNDNKKHELQSRKALQRRKYD